MVRDAHGGSERPPAAELVRVLPLDEEAPRTARALVDSLRGGLDEAHVEALRQIVGELVAQCVQDGPAGDRVTIRLRPVDGRLELEVSRPRHAVPAGWTADPDPQAGDIGFRLVNELVERWGVSEDGETTVVWVSFRVA